MIPWLPNRESSAKSSPWRTIVVPNASLGRNLSGSSRACETRFLDIDLWYCSAASCSLGDAVTSSWQAKDEAGIRGKYIEQAHRCSPSLRRSISCSSSFASPVSVVLSLALITSSAHCAPISGRVRRAGIRWAHLTQPSKLYR